MTLLLAAVLAATSTIPQFSSSVQVVRLSVTVQDSKGNFVTDLAASDFSIIEGGVGQEIMEFQRDLPLDLTFLVDTSDSMGPYLADIYRSVLQFTKAIAPDTVQIIQFAQFALIVQPPTDDMVELQGSLAKLNLFAEYDQRIKSVSGKGQSKKPEDIIFREALHEWLCNRAMCGATALHTGVYVTVRSLKKERTQMEDGNQRRQAIILFTDGEDTASVLTAEDVLKEVGNLEVPIYAFRLDLNALPGNTRETDAFLMPLIERTGGRYRTVVLTTELAPWYRKIAEELRSQYHIAYTSNATQGNTWRPIQVSIGHPDYQIRHRLGYYAPKE